ncbi:hypothetical protein AB0D29_20805 [Streptomyces sp. NPDC048424]|uniref:hypothetical protein n=1 Tax=Streptomyces sp. NPDC048424 TaxID=3155265 RepID=UPI0034357CD5
MPAHPDRARRTARGRRREQGAERIGLIGLSAGGHLAAHDVPHTVHVCAHGPHGLGLARGAGDATAWTTHAASWIAEQIDAPAGFTGPVWTRYGW